MSQYTCNNNKIWSGVLETQWRSLNVKAAGMSWWKLWIRFETAEYNYYQRKTPTHSREELNFCDQQPKQNHVSGLIVLLLELFENVHAFVDSAQKHVVLISKLMNMSSGCTIFFRNSQNWVDLQNLLVKHGSRTSNRFWSSSKRFSLNWNAAYLFEKVPIS